MLKSTLFALLLSISSLSFAQSSKDLLNQGIALHDKGDYAGAIAKYDEIIGKDENYYDAYFEKSLTLITNKKYEDCIELCKLILKKFPSEEKNRNVYVHYGTALDNLGEGNDAVKIYSQGIKKFSESYLLYFNRGITLYGLEKKDDAAEDFKKSMTLKPLHASSHQALAVCVEDKNKTASLFSRLAFLLIEPEGKRAETNLAKVKKIVGGNVEKKDDKNITIFLAPGDLDSKGKKEDDFSMAELTMGLTSALDYDDKYKDEKPAERMKRKLETLIAVIDESKMKKKGFFTKFYLPFFKALVKNNMLETACNRMLASDKDKDATAWLAANNTKEDALIDFLNNYKWGDGE